MINFFDFGDFVGKNNNDLNLSYTDMDRTQTNPERWEDYFNNNFEQEAGFTKENIDDFPSSYDKILYFLNQKIERNDGKKINSDKQKSGNGKNTNKGRKKKNSGNVGKHTKFSLDNMIKKSLNLSLKFSINKLNEDFAKIKDYYESLKSKFKENDEMLLKIKLKYTKRKAKELMGKNFETIFSESKVYGYYQKEKKEDENYNQKSIDLINGLYKSGEEELGKFVNFLKTPYGEFWKRLRNNSNEKEDNSNYLDQIAKEYYDYIDKKYNKKEEDNYNNKIKNFQKKFYERINK